MSYLAPQIPLRRRAMAVPAVVAGLVTVAMIAGAGRASAAQPYETRTVYYKPSELTTDQGTRALYGRIEAAAAMACPPEDSERPYETATSRECQRQAIARAVAEIGSARLTALFAHSRARYR
jgi:UrcA family protein